MRFSDDAAMRLPGVWCGVVWCGCLVCVVTIGVLVVVVVVVVVVIMCVCVCVCVEYVWSKMVQLWIRGDAV